MSWQPTFTDCTFSVSFSGVFTASVYWSWVMYPSCSISLSTMLRWFSLSFWFSSTSGSYWLGFLVMAAMVADCTTFRSAADTLK